MSYNQVSMSKNNNWNDLNWLKIYAFVKILQSELVVAYKNKNWVKVHLELAMTVLYIPKILEIYFLEEHNLLQPCAVKVACTVVRGGKLERAYLSRSDQQVYFSGELKQK